MHEKDEQNKKDQGKRTSPDADPEVASPRGNLQRVGKYPANPDSPPSEEGMEYSDVGYVPRTLYRQVLTYHQARNRETAKQITGIIEGALQSAEAAIELIMQSRAHSVTAQELEEYMYEMEYGDQPPPPRRKRIRRV